uniref:Uncharacterized protein n=1 Tax=Siphoviridae sp. ctWWc42 TaxID=2826361 RepID=A0A8S5R146_9CAUD|nr:MAG TPA: hypothetical protein [Siphoviridae sp. ctWWc42]
MDGNPVVGTIVVIVLIVSFYLVYCGFIYDMHRDKYSSFLATVISPVIEFRQDRTPPCYKCKYCKSIGFCSRKPAVAYKESKLNAYLPYGAKCDEIRGTYFCKFKEGPKDEVESKKLMFTETESRDHMLKTLETVGGHGYRKLCKSVPVHEDIPLGYSRHDL